MKITVYDLTTRFYEAKTIIIMDAVHYNSDGHEEVNEITTNDRWLHDVKDEVSVAEVMMLKVAENYFIEGVNHSIFVTDEKKDFTFNQLTRLLPLPSVEVANELVEKEVLSPDMTVKEITKVVKDYNHKDESTEETEGATEEITEESTVDTIEVAFTQALNAYDTLITEYVKKGDEELTHILEAMKDKLSHIRDGYSA